MSTTSNLLSVVPQEPLLLLRNGVRPVVSGQGGQRLGPTLPGAPEPAPLCPCWGLLVSGDLCHPQLDVADLQKELDKSQSMFPENPSVWVKDLAGYLNYKLQAPKSDPALSQHAHGQWHPPAAPGGTAGTGGVAGGHCLPRASLGAAGTAGAPTLQPVCCTGSERVQVKGQLASETGIRSIRVDRVKQSLEI